MGVLLGSSEESTVVVGSGSPSVSVSVIGQTVVEMGIVSVTTTVESAGQSGTSGAHDVTVWIVVVKIVEVVMLCEGGGVVGGVGVGSGVGSGVGGTSGSEEGGTSGSSVGGTSGFSVSVSVMGQTVVEIAIVSVTTVVSPSVQSGSSGPQSVTVWIDVVKMVDVVMLGVVSGTSEDGVTGGVVSVMGVSEEGTGGGVGAGVSVVVGVTSGSEVGGTSGSEEGGTSGSSVGGTSGFSASVSVIGHTVVEMAMVSVTRIGPSPSVQPGSSGPQSVTVRISVVKMVEVVIEADADAEGVRISSSSVRLMTLPGDPWNPLGRAKAGMMAAAVGPAAKAPRRTAYFIGRAWTLCPCGMMI